MGVRGRVRLCFYRHRRFRSDAGDRQQRPGQDLAGRQRHQRHRATGQPGIGLGARIDSARGHWRL